MSSSILLTSLISRKAMVNQDIFNSKANIANLEDKISRLSQAKKSLDDSISNLESIKSEVDDFEVSTSKWEGDTERNFIGKYNSFALFVKIYKSDTEEAKNQIDEALQNAKEEKSNADMGLGNLEVTLLNLVTSIASAKENV